MTDYGKGAVLSSVSVLPATSAGLLFADRVNPLILAGLIAVSVFSLVTLVAYISRYLINKKG